MMSSLVSLKVATEVVQDDVEGLSTPTNEDSNLTSSAAANDVTAESAPQHDETIVSDEIIVAMCDKLLCLVTSRAVDMVKDLRAHTLRAILMSVSMLPLQVDDCVDTIEREVARRIGLLENAPRRNIDQLLQQVASNASDVKRLLFGEEPTKESRSPLASLKDGLKGIFRSPSPKHESGEDEPEKLDLRTAYNETNATELVLRVKMGLQSIIDAATGIGNATQGCQLSLDKLMVAPQHEALFELGRCSELIEQYRRIDFVSGSRRSRFDEERRRDMAKRVLSRKLP